MNDIEMNIKIRSILTYNNTYVNEMVCSSIHFSQKWYIQNNLAEINRNTTSSVNHFTMPTHIQFH